MENYEDGILMDSMTEEQEEEPSLADFLGLEEDEEQDLAETLYWLEKSGDVSALVRIAKIYEAEGEMELAREYYELARKQG